MARIKVLLGATLLMMATATAGAAVRESRYLGYATDLKSGRYLYTEVHRQQHDGERWLGGSIRYVAPDGSLLGEKTLDFRRDRYIPLMRYRLFKPAYEEAVTAITADTVSLVKVSDGKRRLAQLKRSADMAADSGFNAFVVEHLDQLAAGREVSLRFAVIGQLDQYRFRVSKTGELRREGEPAIRLAVRPDSLLRYLVPELTLVYGLQSRRLLEYVGVSNILDPATGKAYAVRIIYGEKPPAGAPAALPTPD